MKKYDTVVFDLDGTLLNTLDDLADSVNEALRMHGFPCRTVQEIRQFVGNGVGNLMERAIPKGRENPQFDQCLNDFRAHYSKNLQNKTKPYPGIMELLKRLSEKGYKMAVVSNKFDTAVKGLCKTYFGQYIKVAIGESAGVAKKPAPDTVFQALRELGSETEQSVYVGDSDVDVKTAHNASLPCIGVTWGFRDRELLISEGADMVIDSPGEFLNAIE